MQIKPVTPSFAADVLDVDVTKLSERAFREVYSAWLEFGVLRIRDQPLTESQLQEFSGRFGPLEEAPFGRMTEAQKAKIKNRYVTQISNIRVDGESIGGLGNSEASWHSDMTYVAKPPPASILLAIEIPEQGGDTHFADQAAAFDALPQALRSRITALCIKHDAAHTSIGKLRPGFDAFEDPREAPGAIHPIILTHNETRHQALYLGRREWAYVPGLTLKESEALLDELWGYAALPENVWRQTWRPHDLIIWDNRRVLHRRDEFDNTHRRLMKRCQVCSAF